MRIFSELRIWKIETLKNERMCKIRLIGGKYLIGKARFLSQIQVIAEIVLLKFT